MIEIHSQLSGLKMLHLATVLLCFGLAYGQVGLHHINDNTVFLAAMGIHISSMLIVLMVTVGNGDHVLLHNYLLRDIVFIGFSFVRN